MSKKNPNEVRLECSGEDDRKSKLAKLTLNPAVDAAVIASHASKAFEPDINELIMELIKETNKAAQGDMSSLEKMLAGQAFSMNYAFKHAMNKAMGAEYLNQFQAYSKTAMKAQNQCRQAILALAEIKNPKRTTFIKNQATNQQVNFNSEKNQNESNELLREEHHAPMDITGKTEASGVNQDMETVEALHWSGNTRRERGV